MKISNSVILIFWAVLIQSISAKCSPASASMTPVVHQDGKCTVNPPSNFMATHISTGWADLQWDLVPGATQYLVKTYDVVSGLEVHSALVSGNISTVRVTWPDNCSLNMESRAWSIDNSGQSNNYSSAPFHGVILDLLTLGYSYTSASNEVCIVTSALNTCSNFEWGGGAQTSFKISPPFGADLPDGAYTVEGSGSVNQSQIYVRYNPGKFYSFSTNHISIFIKSGVTNVATLEPVFAPNANSPEAYLHRVDNYPGFTIKKQGVAYFGPDGGNSTDDRFNLDETPQTISAFPNPFKAFLKISMPEPLLSGTNISLYNLLGALQIRQTIPVGQNDVTLNTIDLLPGMYILKTESGGKVETFKVLKTQ